MIFSSKKFKKKTSMIESSINNKPNRLND